MTAERQPSQMSLLSRIWSHILGKPLDIQKALKTAGVQPPDSIGHPATVKAVIIGLPDDQVDKVADILGLTARNVQLRRNQSPGYSVTAPWRSDGILNISQEVFRGQAPNRSYAFRTGLVNLHQSQLSQVIREPKWQRAILLDKKPGIPIIDTLSIQGSHARWNLIDGILGRTHYNYSYTIDSEDSGRIVYDTVIASSSEQAKLKLRKMMMKYIMMVQYNGNKEG